MRDASVYELGLPLGTLVYQGSPTVGSVIVYSSARNRWGRVPMQDVNIDMDHHPVQRLLGILRSDRVAQCMLMVLMLALMLVGIGGYGFSKHSARHAAQPRSVVSTAHGEAPPPQRSLAVLGSQGSRQAAVGPLSF